MKARIVAALCLLLVFACSTSADQVEFFLTGAAGDGLLPGNIAPPTTSTGSGGIGGTGIILDTDTNIISIDIEWGSENGYSDLTGEVVLLHLHGPTASLPPFNFGEMTMDLIINLGNSLNFNSSASGGGLIDQFFLSNQEVEYLLSGRTYINVHTSMYPMGEIRGYLLPVSAIPEPGTTTLVAFSLITPWLNRRRRSQSTTTVARRTR